MLMDNPWAKHVLCNILTLLFSCVGSRSWLKMPPLYFVQATTSVNAIIRYLRSREIIWGASQVEVEAGLLRHRGERRGLNHW